MLIEVFSIAGLVLAWNFLFMKIVFQTRSDVNSACLCVCNQPHQLLHFSHSLLPCNKKFDVFVLVPNREKSGSLPNNVSVFAYTCTFEFCRQVNKYLLEESTS